MYPWLIPVAFRYHPKVIEYIKQIPGAQWQPGEKTWLVPLEMFERLEQEAAKCKVTVRRQQAALPDKLF